MTAAPSADGVDVEDAASPRRERASIWWWTGGLVIGVASFFAISFRARAVLVYVETKDDGGRNRAVEAQLPAVQSAVERVVGLVDPEAQVTPVGSCNGDTPARVSVILPVEPDDVDQVAARLEREAERTGWRTGSDPQHLLERSFAGHRFSFQAIPTHAEYGGYDAVFVRAYSLDPENC